MQLSDFVNPLTLSLGALTFVAGINLRTYNETRRWLSTHKISTDWNEAFYRKFKEESQRGAIIYYVGYPGRLAAYCLHSE